MKAYLALGSNIGNSIEYINAAIDEITKNIGKVIKVSKFYKTKPYGYTDQADFINAAVLVDTMLDPYKLLEKIHIIEKKLGRERKIRWGPRTIDIDIIFYEDIILDEDNLHIPHIDFENRDFVIRPLMDIDDKLVNPRNGKKLINILK